MGKKLSAALIRELVGEAIRSRGREWPENVMLVGGAREGAGRPKLLKYELKIECDTGSGGARTKTAKRETLDELYDVLSNWQKRQKQGTEYEWKISNINEELDSGTGIIE